MHTQMRSMPLPVPPSRSGSRRIGVWVLVTTLLLIVFVTIGGLVEQHLFEGTAGAVPLTPTIKPHVGSFVQPPLDLMQVDALRHLVTHMKYKQLASLYVAHMTLDEELGQLIMVEYDDTYYSPDLDMIVNQLHAGGIIMYEFQMLTFNQTKHDIALMQQHAKIRLLI
jgi:beta-N-acetylhexosaminidase